MCKDKPLKARKLRYTEPYTKTTVCDKRTLVANQNLVARSWG